MTSKRDAPYILGSVFTGILIVLFLGPVCYVGLRSFWSAEGISFINYYDVFWAQAQYLLTFWRSLGMALCVGGGQMVVSVLAGYCFARFKFAGRDGIFFFLMILMVLPVQVTLVPNYIMLSQLGLLDSMLGLILPLIFAPLGTFILRQSFISIPDSIIDAAMLDGCDLGSIIVRVALPMNKSGLVCAFLLSFLDAWNMVEQPIAYMKNFYEYPLSVALAYVPPVDEGLHMVCCVLAALPCLFLFAAFSQELVEGIVLAEVK